VTDTTRPDGGPKAVAPGGDEPTGETIVDSPEMGGGSRPVGALARSAALTAADGEDEPSPSYRAVLAHAPVVARLSAPESPDHLAPHARERCAQGATEAASSESSQRADARCPAAMAHDRAGLDASRRASAPPDRLATDVALCGQRADSMDRAGWERHRAGARARPRADLPWMARASLRPVGSSSPSASVNRNRYLPAASAWPSSSGIAPTCVADSMSRRTASQISEACTLR